MRLAPALPLPLALLATVASAQEPLLVLDAPAGAAGFGYRVAAIGDVDGDGLPDVAVAERGDRVHVLAGASLDVLRTIPVPHPHVAGVASVDTDGDGIDEVVIAHQSSTFSAFVYVEAFDVATGAMRWSYYDFQFGGEDEVRFARCGDYDGDGVEDLLVGMPDQDIWHPAWWESSFKVLSGAHGGRLIERTHNPEGFGEGIAAVGDVDQDGRPDLVVGSRSDLTAGTGGQSPWQRGTVALFHRSSSPTPLWSVDGSHPEAEFGEDVCEIGDRDGDGIAEIAVLESIVPAGGTAARTLRVHAMSGASGAFLGHRDFVREAAPGPTLEAELEPIDDVDGDGLSDVVMVVPRSGVHGGPEVRVLSGASLATLHAWSVDLQEDPADLGSIEAAAIGDLDGDGAPEILVGRADGAAGAGRALVLPTGRSVGVTTCTPAVVNSTGRPADLRVTGPLSVAENRLSLIGIDVPASTWVLPIAGTAAANVPMAGGSTGTLCVGGAVRRLGDYIERADAGGAYVETLDLTAWHPSAPTAAQPGETWHFQLWFRDGGPAGATSNFSDAARVTFR